jgi:hypothetical protein
MAHRVFICYSSRNGDIAEAARNALEALKIPCWMAPRDIDAGEEWAASIIDAIEACQIVIVIFSRDADKSPQVKREVERGVSKDKALILFRIEDAMPSGSMEFGVSIAHWRDAFTLPMKHHLGELSDDVATLLRKRFPDPRQDHALEIVKRSPQPMPIGPQPKWAPEDLPPVETLWPTVELTCHNSVNWQLHNNPQSIGEKYQRRAIEDTFAEFVQSPAKGMFLIGDSGMGKTTLLIRLLTEYQSEGHLCAMFESRELPTGLPRLEAHLVKKLSGTQWVPHTSVFWTLMDGDCDQRVNDQQQKRRLLVFIDAVNEFSPGKADPRPVHLLDELDRIIQDVNTPASNIKFVITCRPETWRRATDNAPTRFRTNPATYFSPKGPRNEIAWVLPRFSDQEFAGAYEKYRAEGQIATSFEQLSPVAVYHLKDPFLLVLASKAYSKLEIPRDLDTGTLFERYFENLQSLKLSGTIDGIVSEMFVGDDSKETITRTSFRRDSDLASRNNSLYAELDFSNDLRDGARLKEQNVIREWREKGDAGDQGIPNIRFTYDRFAEYLLSNRLCELVFRREKLILGENEKTPVRGKRADALAEAAKIIASKNLATSQNSPVVYAALQRTLFLLRKRASSYVTVLKAVSDIDARGQWLVISVLARTARQQSGGIELLAGLLKELGKRKSSSARRFPLIDSVYRVLRDEDYRLWLEEQEGQLKNAHLTVLYEHFVQSFHESDATVWAAGVQYLFFLWKSSSQHAYTDAKNITQRLGLQVGPAIGMAFSSSKRRAFCGLAVLMILLLSEAPADRFNDALEIAGIVIRRLKLKKLGRVANLVIDTFLLQVVLKTLEQLPNPVQLDSLVRYFENRNAELPIAEEVLELLAPDCDPSRISLDTLKRLARTDHSFTVQMMTFVVSVNYERAQTDEARAKALDLARDLFYEEPRTPIAEYCASLALYHINYFGSSATQTSMDLMGRMADSILAERQGHLHLSGKRHNFNIIGTYGRALHKYGGAVDGSGAPDPSAMRYVLTSLQSAREAKDSGFYAYICREVGLLGVLVEPRYLFDVFTSILKDLRTLEEKTFSDELPFPPEQVEKLTDTILQSLANIRVLYRQQVDKYLLEVLESPEIYADVATKRDPDFQLSFFVSWAFEQLIFRALVYYYEEMGEGLLKAFLDSMRCYSSSQCVRIVLSAVVSRCAMLSE